MRNHCQKNEPSSPHPFAVAVGIVCFILTPTSAIAQTDLKPVDGETIYAPGKKTGKAITLDIFLDRLMIAESGGRDSAANPLSSARGAFQFIDATFLFIMQKHFPEKVADLKPQQILALRYNRDVSRKAAAAYTHDNAAYLNERGVRATFTNLRLAFLLGPSSATRVLTAHRAVPLAKLLSPRVIKANPFMARLSARALILRAGRDISVDPQNLAKLEIGAAGTARAARRAIHAHCNLSRASCRRWLALRQRKTRR